MEQRRFLLAMILSALVIFGWQAFFAPEPERVDEDDADPAVQQQVDEDEPVADPAEPVDPDEQAADQPDEPVDPDEQAAVDPDEPVEPVEEDEPVDPADEPEIAEREDVIETNNVRVRFSNRGAAVVNAEITAPEQYTRGSGGDLMRAFQDDPPAWPYELSFDDGNIDLDGDAMFELVEDQSERVGDLEETDGGMYDEITYRHTDPAGRYVVDKTYSVNPEVPADEQFGIDLDIEVHNTMDEGALADEAQLDVVAHPDPDRDDHLLNFRPNLLEGVCHHTDDTVRTALEDLEGYEEYSQHTVNWAGTDTRYFITAAVPVDGASACSFDRIGDNYLQTRLYHDGLHIGPDDVWQTSYMLYMGPKDFDILSNAGHELNESVDYGLFSFLARPLRWGLARLYGVTDSLGFASWGLAIILLTLIIKLVTWPITGKAYTSAQKMKQIQPQIKEIREKYEDDQQRMTEETMKLFRENDVSPLGCLPLLLQMPILYGLFVMIYNSVELYHAEFLWYADLSAPDPFYILPVVMGVTMFLQQKITMSASAAGKPQMKIVMKIMPVAFTAFMLFLPAGLVLYYFLNLLVGLFQQYLIKRRFKEADEAGEEI